MANKITYFAITGGGHTVDQPLGLLRRLEQDDSLEDECLNRDLSWSFSPLIVEWEHGGYGRELVEVSHAQASRIVQYFREKFAREADLRAANDNSGTPML
jgi:hypothetical protein